MSEYIEHDVQKVSTPPLVFDTTHPDETADTAPGGAAGALVALDGPPIDGGVPTYDSGTGKHTSQLPAGTGTLDDLTDVDTTGVSDGDVLTYDSGSGDWVAAAPTGGGAGLVLLESHTASASASLDFATRNAAGQSGATIQSDYDEYMIVGSGLVPATTGAHFNLIVGTGGTPTYDTGNNYQWGNQGLTAGGSGFNSSGTSGLSRVMDGMSSGNAAFAGSFTLTAALVNSTTFFKSFYGSAHYVITTGPAFCTLDVGISWTNAATVATAIRFAMSSGNITAGTIKIYGVAK